MVIKCITRAYVHLLLWLMRRQWLREVSAGENIEGVRLLDDDKALSA